MSMWRVLLSNLSIWGTLEPFNQSPVLPQKDTFCFGPATSPSGGVPPWPPEQTLHSSAIMDTNACVRVRVTHALTQVLVISNEPQHIGTALCSTMNSTVACGFRLPSSRSWNARPPDSGFWRPNTAFPLSARKKVPYGPVQNPHMRIHVHGPPRTPESQAALCTNPLSDTA